MIQFCIEEALMARVEELERHAIGHARAVQHAHEQVQAALAEATGGVR